MEGYQQGAAPRALRDDERGALGPRPRGEAAGLGAQEIGQSAEACEMTPTQITVGIGLLVVGIAALVLSRLLIIEGSLRKIESSLEEIRDGILPPSRRRGWK
jgi:hypothetical protein